VEKSEEMKTRLPIAAMMAVFFAWLLWSVSMR
jgi:hypothetical protein